MLSSKSNNSIVHQLITAGNEENIQSDIKQKQHSKNILQINDQKIFNDQKPKNMRIVNNNKTKQYKKKIILETQQSKQKCYRKKITKNFVNFGYKNNKCKNQNNFGKIKEKPIDESIHRCIFKNNNINKARESKNIMKKDNSCNNEKNKQLQFEKQYCKTGLMKNNKKTSSIKYQINDMNEDNNNKKNNTESCLRKQYSHQNENYLKNCYKGLQNIHKQFKNLQEKQKNYRYQCQDQYQSNIIKGKKYQYLPQSQLNRSTQYDSVNHGNSYGKHKCNYSTYKLQQMKQRFHKQKQLSQHKRQNKDLKYCTNSSNSINQPIIPLTLNRTLSSLHYNNYMRSCTETFINKKENQKENKNRQKLQDKIKGNQQQPYLSGKRCRSMLTVNKCDDMHGGKVNEEYPGIRNYNRNLMMVKQSELECDRKKRQMKKIQKQIQATIRRRKAQQQLLNKQKQGEMGKKRKKQYLKWLEQSYQLDLQKQFRDKSITQHNNQTLLNQYKQLSITKRAITSHEPITQYCLTSLNERLRREQYCNCEYECYCKKNTVEENDQILERINSKLEKYFARNMEMKFY